MESVRVGDEISITAQDDWNSVRRCLVVKVLGAGGSPPFVVL